MLSTDEGLQQYVEWVMTDSDNTVEEKKNILERLKDMINSVIKKLKEYVNRENYSASEKAMAEMELKQANELRKQIFSALDNAINSLENGVEVSGKTKNSLENFDEAYDYSKNIDVVAKMESVCNLQGTEFKKKQD